MEGFVIILILTSIGVLFQILKITYFDAPRMKKEKAAEMKLKEESYLAEMNPQERKAYIASKDMSRQGYLKYGVKDETEEEYATRRAVTYLETQRKWDDERNGLKPVSKSSNLVCPHCQMKGGVSSTFGEEVFKTKVVPIIGNTIKTRKNVTKMHCSNCDTEWSV